MPKPSIIPSTYPSFLAELKERIRAARLKASLAVNREIIILYWSIGRDIMDKQEAEGWGASIIDTLAKDLRREFPNSTGFSKRNLFYMKALAAAYPDKEFVQQAAALIPWAHNTRILDAVKSPQERRWYIEQTIENAWSRDVLVVQMERQLYQRQGKALTNFARALPSPQSDLAQQLTKDSYHFDFLEIGTSLKERELQRGLLENILAFILELGKGFAFMGSQYHLAVSNKDYYLDLLFYHVRLRCYVVFELKTTEFKPEYAGKMNFYLSAVDDMLRHPDDKASIGIILCKTRDAFAVEYALRGIGKPMGVAEFKVTPDLPKLLQDDLPTVQEIAAQLQSKARKKPR